MVPQATSIELKVRHDQLLAEGVNLQKTCDALKDSNEQLKEALGSSRFSFSSTLNFLYWFDHHHF